MSGAQPLRLELSSSFPLAAIIAAVHAVAAACLVLVVPGWAGAALGALVVLLGAAAAADRALLLGDQAPRHLLIDADSTARLVLANGATAVLGPLGGIGVTRWWVAMKVVSHLNGGIISGTRRSLFVPVGMLTPEALRLLRVWALWGKLPRSDAAAVAIAQLPA